MSAGLLLWFVPFCNVVKRRQCRSFIYIYIGVAAQVAAVSACISDSIFIICVMHGMECVVTLQQKGWLWIDEALVLAVHHVAICLPDNHCKVSDGLCLSFCVKQKCFAVHISAFGKSCLQNAANVTFLFVKACLLPFQKPRF